MRNEIHCWSYDKKNKLHFLYSVAQYERQLHWTGLRFAHPSPLPKCSVEKERRHKVQNSTKLRKQRLSNTALF